MDESGEDTGQDSTTEEEIPKIITDDYFECLCQSLNDAIKEVEAKQLYTVGEEIQKAIVVCQNLRQTLIEETEKNEKMQEEVTAAAGKVAQVLKISQNDQDTMAKLRQEIEDAWKQKDAAHTREQIAQESMFAIREKLDKLEKESEKFIEKPPKADDELGMSLAKHKEGNVKERDRLKAEVEELNRRLAFHRSYADDVEKKRMEVENKNKELYRLLEESSTGAFKEKRFLESVQNELAEMTTKYEIELEETTRFKALADQHHHTTVQLNLQLAAVRTNLEKLTAQHNLTNLKLAKVNTDLENMTQLKEKITNQLNTKTNILKLKEDENHKYRLESAKLIKSREMLMKKMMSMEQKKTGLENEVTKLKNLLVTLEKEQDLAKKAIEQSNKNAATLVRERDMARKDLVKANVIIGDHVEINVQLKQQIKTIENDVRDHLQFIQKQKSMLATVEKERDRNADEAQVLRDKVDQLNEDLTLKQTQITHLKEKLAEFQTKLTQMQQMFETTRNERNTYQRELQFCTEERDGLKERLRVADRNAATMGEELATKNADLLKLQKQIEKLEKEKQMYRNEVQATVVALQHAKSELHEVNVAKIRLEKIIKDLEVGIEKSRRELECTLKDKEMLGTQLVRRNDEISVLNEKLNVLQIALDRCEMQYTKRCEDIRLLKIEITNLRSQQNLLSRGLANTADMRQEVLQLNRVLIQERVKSKALEEEMSTPMNVHRWRKLSGKDPEKMEMIVKINALQRQVLAKTTKSTDLEEKLKTAEQTYSSLKQSVQKLPDPNVKERLNSTQRALSTRTKKMKVIMAELNILEQESRSKDCELDEVRKALVDTKMALLKEKKEKIQLLERDGEEGAIMLPGHDHRTLGAGFKIPA